MVGFFFSGCGKIVKKETSTVCTAEQFSRIFPNGFSEKFLVKLEVYGSKIVQM